MNQIATVRPNTVSVGGMTPINFGEALIFAQWMAKSKMVPQHFQAKPEECLVIIEQAMRWEMSPYAVIQCASMIQGRPMYEGKLVAAVINSKGPRYGLIGRLSYAYEGEGAARSITVTGTIAGENEPRSIEVALKDAKTTNGMWVKQPDQQLAYHGARVWARRHMPELMLGVNSPEEMEPVTEPAFVENRAQRPAVALAAQAPPRARDAVDDDAIPALEGPPPDKQADATMRLITKIEACQTEEDLHALSGDGKIGVWRAKLAAERPDLDTRIADAFGARYEALIVAQPLDEVPE